MGLFNVKATEHKKQIIKCDFMDHFVSNLAISVVFLYRQPIPEDLFIRALRDVLNDFPLFSSQLVMNDGQLYIDCNNQGVQVNVVKTNYSLFESFPETLKKDTTIYVDKIDPAKCLKQGKPVLTIKLNYHPDGMTLGFSWHHSVGDMSTFMEFLSALSNFAKGNDYQKPLIVEDRGIYLQQRLPQEQPNDAGQGRLKILSLMDIFRLILKVCSPKKTIYLYFSPEEIAAIKNELNQSSTTTLSRNDAICAYMLDIIDKCRADHAEFFNASIVLNYRKRISMPSNVLGNFFDTIMLKNRTPIEIKPVAESIHHALQHYDSNRYWELMKFVHAHGGIKNISRVIEKGVLAQNKPCFFTNWSNFSVYSIDFGIAEPYLFLPIGQDLVPWVSCIVEGFENKGLLVSLLLPAKTMNRFIQSDMLRYIHRYRKGFTESLADEKRWYY